jgi:putative transcriptional regulator
LLIAHPGLMDPNFRRSVLIISQNDAAEGSFGLILNRPSGRTVADFLPDRDEIGALGNLPVYLGGPVGRDQLAFAYFKWQKSSHSLVCRHHLSIEEAVAKLDDGGAIVRPFIGYAGWGKGQLEGELAQNAWLLKRPHPDILDLDNVERLWPDLIGSFGPKFRLIADAPENPSLN